MPFGFSFGSDITKTVTSDGAQVTFKVTYPSLRPNEYGSDSKRRDISEKFIQRAQDEVREYLKKKDPKSYPSVDEKNVRRMGKGNVTDNTTLLDKIAYASLSKYSLHFKDGEKVEKVTSTNNGKTNCLLDLIGGNLKKTTSGTTGGWHQANSEIGNDEVTVTFEFDFSNVHENKDLLKWQGKVPEEPERRSESSNYDPYAIGPARGDIGDNPNPHPDDVMRNQAGSTSRNVQVGPQSYNVPVPPTPLTAEEDERVKFANHMNAGMFKIKEATPSRFTLEDGRAFFSFPGLRIYSEKKWGSKHELFSADKGRFNTNGGHFYPWQRDELQRSYVDTNQIPADEWSSPSSPTAGGRKSTRRRQRRSNTRRIKQRKQSRKNHTRHRKSIRK